MAKGPVKRAELETHEIALASAIEQHNLAIARGRSPAQAMTTAKSVYRRTFDSKFPEMLARHVRQGFKEE
jgi:hypothetical protein